MKTWSIWLRCKRRVTGDKVYSVKPGPMPDKDAVAAILFAIEG